MNYKNHIVALVLAIYFFSIPVVISIHINRHTFNQVSEKNKSYNKYTITEDIHCILCDFDVEQPLYIKQQAILSMVDYESILEIHFSPSIVLNVIKQLYPRGPPSI